MTPHLRQHVWAIMPAHGEVPERALVEETLGQVAGLVVVDDGSDAGVARALRALADDVGAALVRIPERRGKGAALRAGLGVVREISPSADAVLTIDADGQHPASAIPAFLAAATSAELVIGDRFDDLAAMPRPRRLANRASRRLLELSTGRPVRDTQCGMRLLRGRALDLPLEGNGYEAETRHLKAALESGLDVAWVPIPAIYGDEQSSFRALRDSARVLVALVRPVGRRAPSPSRLQSRRGPPRRHPTSSAPRGRPVTTRPGPQSEAPAP
jgi:glycosyltransferase involved in cell wall biosynthesis